MTRGLLSIGLCAAVLLVGVGAKPPDLPADQDYYVTPQVSPDLNDWVMPLVPSAAERGGRFCVGAILMPPEQPELASMSWLFRLSPTPRRQLASCLLLVAHPLLLLMPTEHWLDIPADHPCPEPTPINTDSLPETVQANKSPRPLVTAPGWILVNEKNFDGLSPCPATNSMPTTFLLHFCPRCKAPTEVEVGGAENGSSESVRRIEQCLGRFVSLQFVNTPLQSVVDDLRERFGINIYLDVRAFEEGGICSENLKVNAKLENLSLKSALDLILRPLGLVFVIKDDVLQITTPACARGKLQTKLYAIQDLLHQAGLEDGSSLPLPEEQLIKLIASTIAPESWREMGGPGVIEYFPTTKTLVINQTVEVQEQVAGLLESLRQSKHRWEEQQRQTDVVRVEGLLKACRILHETGNSVQAEKLAWEAYALDADRVLDDPVVALIYLRVRQQSRAPNASATSSEPCGICPAGYSQKECQPAAPIRELLPIDPKAVKPLEVIEEESELTRTPRSRLPLAEAKPFHATSADGFDLTEAKDSAQEQENSLYSLSGNLLELCLSEPSGHGYVEIGLGTTGPAVSGHARIHEWMFHVMYRNGSFAIWTTPCASPAADDK